MPYVDKDKQKQYLRDYTASNYAVRKSEYLDYLGGVCVMCGSDEGLEIDHVDWQSKSFGVMSRWTSPDQNVVYAELDKCQLLCGAHHKLKTAQDKAEMSYFRPISHGTVYAWQKLKCHCDTCNTAKRAWNDERNARRRASM